MAATLVQSAEGTSTLATVTASFPSTPTNGNLIVLCFASDDYNGTPNTGWTQSTGMEQQTYHGSYLWWRVASGGSNSFQYTIGSAANSSWVLLEISGIEASPYDVSNGQFRQSSGQSYTTPAITPSAGDRFLVASMGASLSGGADMSGDLGSWLNSFTHIRSSGPSTYSGTADSVGVATLAVTANGSTSYSTGATTPFTGQTQSGLIIAFKVASGGGGAVNGSLSQTISAVTQSATGKVLIQGSVSQTIAAITQTATGKVIKSGSFAQTIDPVTQTASGNLIVSGSLSGTIGDFTLSAAGGAAVTGSVDVTIDPITQSASGSVVIQGSFGQSIGPVVQSATGGVIIKGSFGQTIDPVTLVAAGSSSELPEIEGQFDQTIGPLTLTATGEGPRQDQTDTHDGRVWDFSQSERDEQERTKARRASEKQLRRAIERAVKAVHGSGEVPSQAAQVEASRPQVADLVLRDINTNGLSASLESIERLLAQYESQIEDEELENDALALLLMAA